MLTFLAGLLITAAAAFLGLREIALNGDMRTLPSAPGWIRFCMFGFMVILAYRGAELILSSFDKPVPVDRTTLLIYAALALYHGAMLVNVLMQRYPARYWKRIQRIEELAKCNRNGWALGILQSLGWTVWAPQEGVLPDPDI